jgi:hypothetical protein
LLHPIEKHIDLSVQSFQLSVMPVECKVPEFRGFLTLVHHYISNNSNWVINQQLLKAGSYLNTYIFMTLFVNCIL